MNITDSRVALLYFLENHPYYSLTFTTLPWNDSLSMATINSLFFLSHSSIRNISHTSLQSETAPTTLLPPTAVMCPIYI